MDSRVHAAHAMIGQAMERYHTDQVYAAFSGGHDSATATHVTSLHPAFRGVVHIDTTIGIPQTRRYVDETCARQGWPLHVAQPAKIWGYVQIVLRFGFPGPAQHPLLYRSLKQRPLSALLTTLRERPGQNIILCTGMRQQESARRMRLTDPIRAEANIVWVSPLWDWSALDCTAYMRDVGLARNPVKERLHISGECLCVAPDTLIATPTGWRPISDIAPGEDVLAYGEGGLGARRVHEIHRRDPAPMLRLKPYFLLPVDVTDNHPLWVRPYIYAGPGLRKIAQAPRWVSAGAVAAHCAANKQLSACRQQRYYVGYYVGYPFRGEQQRLALSAAHLRLLGYFMAEGAYMWRKDRYRDRPGGLVFTVSARTRSREMAQCIADDLRTAFGHAPGWREYTDKRTGRAFIMVRLGHKAVSDFVARFTRGRYCAAKSFTDDVMTAAIDQQAIILDAMWEGDGADYTVVRAGRGDETVSAYGTKSRLLALQVQEMMLRQGRIYGVNRSGNDSFLVRRCSGVTRRAFIEGDVLWTAVQHVGAAGLHEACNLTVEGEPNYRTPAGLVHNCGCFADRHERQELRSWYPDVDAHLGKIEALVRYAADLGLPGYGYPDRHGTWGWGSGNYEAQQQALLQPPLPLCYYCHAGREGDAGPAEEARPAEPLAVAAAAAGPPGTQDGGKGVG